MYIIRDDRGVLVGKIDNILAGKVINSAKGEWREKKYVDGDSKIVFVMLEEAVLSTVSNIIYLWKNYYLCGEY